MVYRDCYYCHSNQNFFYASENGFILVKCQHCGLLFVNPIPAESQINQSHSIGVHQGTNVLNVTGTFKKRKIPHFLTILNDFFTKSSDLHDKKWLDIGCGNGEFIAALNKFSNGKIRAIGLEPNILKQKIAQKKGLDVNYFDLEKHEERYDVISLLNVFSHLPDPPKAIASWSKLLNPNGLLLLKTGDTANLDSKNHFRPFYLPDHLSFGSEKLVVGILERTGFNILQIHKYPFLVPNFSNIIREFAKLFWPNQISSFRYLFKYYIYKTSIMYILAKREG